MKVYVITTGVIFGLLTVAHVVRLVMGEQKLATDPVLFCSPFSLRRLLFGPGSS